VPSITPEEVQAMLASGQRVQIIDTRPRHYSSRAVDIVEGAVWRDPEHVDDWIGTLSKEAPVVTFCVPSKTEFAEDSLLEGGGLELPVRGHR